MVRASLPLILPSRPAPPPHHYLRIWMYTFIYIFQSTPHAHKTFYCTLSYCFSLKCTSIRSLSLRPLESPNRRPHKTRGQNENGRLVISEIKVYLRLRSINSISPCRLIVYNSYNTEIYCIWRHHLFHLDFLISFRQTRNQYLSHRAEPGSFHSPSLILSLQLIPFQSAWPGAGPSLCTEHNQQPMLNWW